MNMTGKAPIFVECVSPVALLEETFRRERPRIAGLRLSEMQERAVRADVEEIMAGDQRSLSHRAQCLVDGRRQDLRPVVEVIDRRRRIIIVNPRADLLHRIGIVDAFAKRFQLRGFEQALRPEADNRHAERVEGRIGPLPRHQRDPIASRAILADRLHGEHTGAALGDAIVMNDNDAVNFGHAVSLRLHVRRESRSRLPAAAHQ